MSAEIEEVTIQPQNVPTADIKYNPVNKCNQTLRLMHFTLPPALLALPIKAAVTFDLAVIFLVNLVRKGAGVLILNCAVFIL